MWPGRFLFGGSGHCFVHAFFFGAEEDLLNEIQISSKEGQPPPTLRER
jgi:hypothetical protein